MASKFLSTMPYSLQPGRYGETAPFNLARIVGNISKCAGCGNKYCKPPVPPYDLCVQHREWRSFTSPGGGPQSKFSPSYYHVNLQCIRRNWPLFSPRHLIISPEMSSKLKPVHKEFKVEGRIEGDGERNGEGGEMEGKRRLQPAFK